MFLTFRTCSRRLPERTAMSRTSFSDCQTVRVGTSLRVPPHFLSLCSLRDSATRYFILYSRRLRCAIFSVINYLPQTWVSDSSLSNRARSCPSIACAVYVPSSRYLHCSLKISLGSGVFFFFFFFFPFF